MDDQSQKALRQVEKATDSDPVKGEDLLGSDELKRGYREIKKEIAKLGPLPPFKPKGKKPVK